MFNLPHQMTCGTGVSPVQHRRDAGATRYAATIIGTVMLIAGCTQQESAGPGRHETAVFSNAAANCRIEVAGSLTSLLPHYDATPALQAFLYGPSDYGKTALRNPQGMCLVGQRLLVGDQNYPAIVAVDLTTGRSLLWEKDEMRCRCPVALVTDGQGRVYVADTTLRAVLVFDANGHLLNTLKPDEFAAPRFRPTGLAWHDGVLYVGNVGDHRIDRYTCGTPELTVNRQGAAAGAALIAGAWLEPIRSSDAARIIAPSGLAISPRGELLVADAVLGTLNRFSFAGESLGRIARSSRAKDGLVRPKQIAVCENMIFVTDAGRQSVQVYGIDGRWLLEIAGQPAGWAGWTLPMGLLTCPLPSPSQDEKRPSAKTEPKPQAVVGPYVLVSDSLGPVSVTVLKIQSRGTSTQEVAHAP